MAFRAVAGEQKSEIMEGRLIPDHAHMVLSVSPKCAVAQVVGYIKGKNAIHIARVVYAGRRRNFVGQHF